MKEIKDAFGVSQKYGFDDYMKGMLRSRFADSLAIAKKYGFKHPLEDMLVQTEEEKLDNRLSNYDDRITAAGGDVPEPSDNKNWVLKTIEALDKPRNALWNAVQDSVSGENGFWQGAKEGWQGTERVSGTDLLDSMGWKGTENPDMKWYNPTTWNLNNIARGTVGTLAEIVGDPLTYATMGLGSVVKGAATGVVKSVGRETGEAVAKAVTRKITDESLEKMARKSLVSQGVKDLSKEAITSESMNLARVEAEKIAQKYGFSLGKQLDSVDNVADMRKAINTPLEGQLGQFYEATNKNVGLGIDIPFTNIRKELVSGDTMRKIGVGASNLATKIPLIDTGIERMQEGVRAMTDGLAVFKGMAAPTAVAAKMIVNRAKGTQSVKEKMFMESMQKFVGEGVKAYGKEEFERMDELVYKVLEGSVDEKELDDSFLELVFGAKNSTTGKRSGGLMDEFDKIKNEEFDAGVLRSMTDKYFPKIPKLRDAAGDRAVEKKLARGGFTEKLKISNPHGFESTSGSTLSIANRYMNLKTSDRALQDEFMESVKDIVDPELWSKYGHKAKSEGDAFEALTKDIPKDTLDELVGKLDGVSDFFETSFTKALLVRQLRSGKVLADKEILDDMVASFGEKMLNPSQMYKAVEDGRDVIIPRSSLNVVVTSASNADTRKVFKGIKDVTDELQYGDHQLKMNSLRGALDELSPIRNSDAGTRYSRDVQDKMSSIFTEYEKDVAWAKKVASYDMFAKARLPENLKALGIKKSVAIQEAIQGDSLVKITGGITDKALERRVKSAKKKMTPEEFDAKILADTEAAKLHNERVATYDATIKSKKDANKQAKDIETQMSKVKRAYTTDGDPLLKGRNKISLNNTDVLLNDKVIGKATDNLREVLTRWTSSDDAMVKINPKDLETFENEMVRLGVSKNIIEAYSMPKGSIEYLNTASRNQKDAGMLAIQGTIDSIMRMWKPTVTMARPVYYLRNLVGGNINNFMDIGMQVLNPTNQMDGLRITQNAKGGTIDFNGELVPVNDVKNAMIKRGALQGFQADEFEDTRKLVNAKMQQAEMGTAKFIKSNPLEGVRMGATKLGRGMETQIRATNFVANVRKALDEGYSLELAYDYAAEQVRKFQFDYTDITDAERNVFRRIVPFYTWMRKNVPLQLEKALNDPSFIAAFDKAQNNMEQATGTDMTNAPAWLKESFALPIQKNLMLDFSVPQKDLTTTVANPLKAAIGGLNPLLKAPIEMLVNKNFATGAPIFKDEDHKIAAGRDYLLGQTGIVNDAYQYVKREIDRSNGVQTEKELTPMLQSILSGTIREYNPDKARMNRKYDYSRALGNKVQSMINDKIDVPDAREAEEILDPRTRMLSRKMRDLLKVYDTKNGGL